MAPKKIAPRKGVLAGPGYSEPIHTADYAAQCTVLVSGLPPRPIILRPIRRCKSTAPPTAHRQPNLANALLRPAPMDRAVTQ